MRSKCKINLCPHKPVHAGTLYTWSGLWWHQYLLHFLCRTFHFFIFYFLFFACTKNTKTQISEKVTFFHSDVFKRIFYFCSLICVFCTFAWFRLCVFFVFFGAFCAFWCVQNLFVKKNKKFKTSLITSFILLLLCPGYLLKSTINLKFEVYVVEIWWMVLVLFLFFMYIL